MEPGESPSHRVRPTIKESHSITQRRRSESWLNFSLQMFEPLKDKTVRRLWLVKCIGVFAKSLCMKFVMCWLQQRWHHCRNYAFTRCVKVCTRVCTEIKSKLYPVSVITHASRSRILTSKRAMISFWIGGWALLDSSWRFLGPSKQKSPHQSAICVFWLACIICMTDLIRALTLPAIVVTDSYRQLRIESYLQQKMTSAAEL